MRVSYPVTAFAKYSRLLSRGVRRAPRCQSHTPSFSWYAVPKSVWSLVGTGLLRALEGRVERSSACSRPPSAARTRPDPPGRAARWHRRRQARSRWFKRARLARNYALVSSDWRLLPS